MDHASAPLTPQQLQAFSRARRRSRSISRAATVAAVSGWSMAVFSFFALVGGLFDLASLALGVGLGVVAYVELRGSKGLRRLDDSAPRMLALNQLGLGALVVAYCAWGLWKSITDPSPYQAYMGGHDSGARLFTSLDHLNRFVQFAVYAALMSISLVAQSCTALYYFTRRGHVLAYLRDTPGWVVEALRVATA